VELKELNLFFLHFINKNEINVYAIPTAEITRVLLGILKIMLFHDIDNKEEYSYVHIRLQNYDNGRAASSC